jgi:hypothetical protein
VSNQLFFSVENLGDNGTSMQFMRRITDAGLYYITADDNETLDNGTIRLHTDTIAVMAETRDALDAKLKAKWNGVRSTLTGNDVNAAAKYFDSSTKTIYSGIFAGMPDQLSQMAQDMADIQLIQAENDRAEYDLRIVRDGTVFSYFVLFVKDENGLWKIKSF